MNKDTASKNGDIAASRFMWGLDIVLLVLFLPFLLQFHGIRVLYVLVISIFGVIVAEVGTRFLLKKPFALLSSETAGMAIFLALVEPEMPFYNAFAFSMIGVALYRTKMSKYFN